MKKILAAVLALIMLLSFAACSGEEKNNENKEIVPERGTVSEGVYKNSAFGVSFEFGENWYVLSDEEIATAMGVAAEEIYGEDVEITGDHLYDFYAFENSTNATVSINYEDLGTVGEMTDANYYLENVMTSLISNGADSGIVDTVISNIKLGNKEVPCLYIVFEYGGSKIYQKLIASQSGTWMSTITIASLSETELSELVGKITLD